jgi:hypothetical protein
MKTMAAEINITNIVEIFLFAGSMVGMYVRMQVKSKEQEMKIIALEQRLQRAEQDDHNLYKRLDQIMQMLTDIKIEMKEKQDRE